jgi:hypothetical protein
MDCNRHSRDSTGPQVNVAPDRLRELAFHDDVCVEELTTRFEDSEHLAECLSLVRREVEHAVADDKVDALRIDGDAQDIACPHFDASQLSTDNRTCGSARAVPLGSPHPGEPLVPEFLNSLERGLMALVNPFVESKSLP